VRSWQNPSKEELTLHAFILSLDLDRPPIFNTKRHIAPLELDILLLEQGVAIEYCGEYYHNDDRDDKHKQYHLNKLLACQQRGYRLITIFSDEWFKRRVACETRLRHLLNKPLKRFFARRTEVVEITPSEAAVFLETYHTQGSLKNSKICLGLRHAGELVAVMTFGPTRLENNANDIDVPGHYELYRFASNAAVVGGASKMFKHFLRTVNPVQVTSFCDRRWGEGGVYQKLGFVLDRTNGPAECWFKNGKRFNRFTLQKHKLLELGYDASRTAYDILKELKYRCVYDCGTYKFIWIKAGV
jgi:hypothetical protein